MSKWDSARRGTASGVFVFMLLGLFAVIATLTVLLSAGAYRGTVSRVEGSNTRRLLSSFVRSSLMSDDCTGHMEVREEEGIQTLCFLEDGFIKRLYCYDSALRELYTEDSYAFDPCEGEFICAAESMAAQWENGLINVTVTGSDGACSQVRFAPRAVE